MIQISVTPNLIDLDKKERELFVGSEDGVDCSFFELPQHAQMIANEFMAMYTTYNDLKREVDRSVAFRDAVRSKKIYMQETDSVMRYWLWKQSGEVMA